MSGLMPQTYNPTTLIQASRLGELRRTGSGFSLIELVIVLGIVGMILAVVVPGHTRNNDKQLNELVSSLTALTQLGYTNALVTGKIHRVFFDIKNNKIKLEESTGKLNAQGKFDFKLVKGASLKTEFTFDERFDLRVSIKGKDETSKTAGITTDEIWFFIMPEGLVQEVTLDIYDSVQERSKTLVMNPFTAQFGIK